MKKFLMLLGLISLGLTSTTTVVAWGKTETVKFKEESKIDLNLVIQNTELGTVYAKDVANPTAEEILRAVILTSENETVKVEELVVEAIESNHATIKVKSNSELYNEGKIIVNYSTSLDRREDLLSIFYTESSRRVGILASYRDPVTQELIPSEWEVFNTVRAWYPYFLPWDIYITNITSTSATINSTLGSKSFRGSMDVQLRTYLDTRPELGRLIPEKNRNLGTFNINAAVPDIFDIFARVQIQPLSVTDITPTSAILRAPINNTFKGEVALTYTVNDLRTELSEAIEGKDFNLGEISTGGTIPLASEILKNDKLKNFKDEVNVLKITETNATIKVKSDSTVYKTNNTNEFIVNYTVNDTRTELNKVIKNTENLEIIKNGDEALKETDILKALEFKNPEVNINDLTVFLDEPASSAIIGVNPYSRNYKGKDIIVTFKIVNENSYL